MATSQRLLGIVIVALLLAGVITLVAKQPEDEPLSVGPSPEPTQTFTFPGPVPTETPTDLFPSETPTETVAGPEVSPSDELPRTGGGSLLPMALGTLALAAAGGVAIRRAARAVS